MFVRMRRTFAYDREDGLRRTIPAGWAGDLDDEIAQRAIEGGYTSEPASDSSPEEVAAGETEATDDMTRPELDAMARAKGLDPDEYRTKADLIEAINSV